MSLQSRAQGLRLKPKQGTEMGVSRDKPVLVCSALELKPSGNNPVLKRNLDPASQKRFIDQHHVNNQLVP